MLIWGSLAASLVTLWPNRSSAIVTAEEAALVPSGIGNGAAAGTAIASSRDGSRVIVGAPGQGEGRAYVFVRTGITWALEATLVHPGAASGDRFGGAVSMSDDGMRVVVSAVERNRAYVFARGATSWSHEATLIPTAGSLGVTEDYGCSVSISGDGRFAAVGSFNFWRTFIQQGRVSIYLRTGTTWVLQHEIEGGAGEQLGAAVALDETGTRTVIGVPASDTGAPNGGDAAIYVREGTTWTREATLTPSGLDPGDEAGRGVAISASGDRVLVGVRDTRLEGLTSAGSATVFVRSGTTWSAEARLISAAPMANAFLGEQLSISADGSRALLGARGGRGRALVFLRRGSVWTEEATLLAAAGGAGDALGTSVALARDGSRAFAGTPGDDRAAVDGGSARVFTLGDAIGTTCASGELCMTGQCVDGVCCESACGDGAVDCLGCSAAVNGVTDGRCLPARSGTLCRAPAGGCDIAEMCDGVLDLCPADNLEPSGEVCREALDRDCDTAEVCDGLTPGCPEDVFAEPGTMCGDAPSGMCDVSDVCEGSRCRPTFAAPGTECGESAVMGVCDTPDVCTGDRADCPPTFLSGVVCRGSTGGCDLPEVCSGTSRSCPPDQVAGPGVVCRASLMESCDPAESCDGASAACPADVMMCMVVPDAGPSTADAGTTSAASGCSCRAVPPGRPSLAWLGLILLGLLAKRRAIPPRHVG